MPPGQGTQVPCGQRAGDVMAAMTATPERVRVGFLTSIPSPSLSPGRAKPRISALLGSDGRPSLQEAPFFASSRSASELIWPDNTASTMALISELRAFPSAHARRLSLIAGQTAAGGQKRPRLTSIRLNPAFCFGLLILLLDLLREVAAQEP